MARFFLYQNQVRPPVIDAPTEPDFGWFTEFSTPQRPKIAAGLAVALLASGLFYSPFVEAAPTPGPANNIVPNCVNTPVSYEYRLLYQGKAEPVVVAAAEDVTLDKWYIAFTDPPKPKSGLASRYQIAFIDDNFTPESITVDKWFAPLGEPRRFKLALLASAQPVTVTDTDPIVSFGWMNELALPPKAKTSVRPASQQAAVVPPFVEDATFESKWHQPWSEPVRFRRGLYAYQQPFATAANTFPLEVIFEDKWHFPWSEPVRLKQGLAARLQQSFIWDALPDDSITGTMESRWHQPWSEPVRQKNGLAARYQISLAWGYTTPEATSVDKWFAWLNEPVSRKRALSTANQQVSVTDTDPVVPFGWFNGLTEPPKPKVTIRLGSQQITSTDTDPVVSFGWFAGLNEPARLKKGLPARLQQFFTFDQSTPAAPATLTITTTLGSQVTYKRRLIYQSVAYTPIAETITYDKWGFPWSEPKRFKRGLATYEQQTLAFNPRPIVSFGFYGWLTEPVRPKKGLQARLQMPVAQPPIRPNLPDLKYAWFAPFSEPVRQKKGLWARLQQFFTYGTPPISPPPATVVLDATETNADTAEFYAVVYNRPVRAWVSIKEVPRADSAYASIEET